MGKIYAEKTLGSSKLLNLKGPLAESLEMMHKIWQPSKCTAELGRKSASSLGTKDKAETENRAAHSSHLSHVILGAMDGGGIQMSIIQIFGF